MTDEQKHRELVAATLASGILAGSQKPVPAGRAIMILNDVLAALTPPPAPVIDQPSEPVAPEPGSDSRIMWITP